MTRKLVWVKWRDAATESKYLYAGDEKDYDSLTTVETVGLFVSETDEALTMATDYMPDENKWRDIHGIPKVNILKRKVFKVE